jgi:hypothetical protein
MIYQIYQIYCTCANATSLDIKIEISVVYFIFSTLYSLMTACLKLEHVAVF